MPSDHSVSHYNRCVTSITGTSRWGPGAGFLLVSRCITYIRPVLLFLLLSLRLRSRVCRLVCPLNLSASSLIHPLQSFIQMSSVQDPVAQLLTPPGSPAPSSPPGPPNQVATPLSFYTVIPLSSDPPQITLDCQSLACKVGNTLGRISKFCIVCYFLGQRRPIHVVKTHERGGIWEELDYHTCQPERCPWRLIHPSTSTFSSFSRELSTSLDRSDSGGQGWTICTRCGEPWDLTCYHDVCFYGRSLFAIAFFVWEDRPARDRVFSYISSRTPIPVPNFQSRDEYTEWAGASISSRPTLNHVHVVVVVYDILRRARILPRYALSMLS